jgi:hypothetical protein
VEEINGRGCLVRGEDEDGNVGKLGKNDKEREKETDETTQNEVLGGVKVRWGGEESV